MFMVFYHSGCPIPVVSDPEKIVIPEGRTPDKIVQNLSYVMEDELLNNKSQSAPLFGGHESWEQREDSFKLKPAMKVNLNYSALSYSLHYFPFCKLMRFSPPFFSTSVIKREEIHIHIYHGAII